MLHLRIVVPAILLAAFCFADTPAPGDGRWRSLFNGKDLAGWRTNVTNQWVVVDGVLTWKQSAVDLWTQAEFSDFVLDLEFKLSPGCNSGVFIRTADIANNVQTGLEIQIWDSAGKTTLEKHEGCALYDAQAAFRNNEKPLGQWNHLAITASGPRIQVNLNGQLVNDIDLDRWTTPGRNPDGTPNKYQKALKDFPRKGFIGLQDHHKPVWFRNVRIRELRH